MAHCWRHRECRSCRDYGGSDGLCGRRTANGERLNCAGMTAAHRTLPFGTLVQVCHSGCVTVRINDRGPFVRGRHIDLSPAAARAIGLNQTGRVTLTVSLIVSLKALPSFGPACFLDFQMDDRKRSVGEEFGYRRKLGWRRRLRRHGAMRFLTTGAPALEWALAKVLGNRASTTDGEVWLFAGVIR